MAESDPNERYMMLIKGGVIKIEIDWQCDYDFNDFCQPKYTFVRYDLPFKETSTASGFNFRFSNKYSDDGVDSRVLYKAFGLRFIISVSGTAGKFNIVPFMMTIGAGIGLMSISVIVADMVMLYCTSDRKLIKSFKETDFEELKNERKQIQKEVRL
jgi:hypothetical protein